MNIFVLLEEVIKKTLFLITDVNFNYINLVHIYFSTNTTLSACFPSVHEKQQGVIKN